MQIDTIDSPNKIIIVDDHQLVLDGLTAMASELEGFEIIGSARNGKEVTCLVETLNPNLVLMDIDMPIMNGLEATFTFSASGEGTYFASDGGGAGKLDIYSVELPEELKPKPSVVLSGVVRNAKDESLIGAWVLVEDIQTGELIATAKSNSESGEYLVVLPSGRDYSVSANKEGFFFYSNKFEVPESAKYEEIKKDIKLEPIEKGARVVLNNIFFETVSAVLTQESYIELSKAVDLLNANKKMIVEVGGHTDNVGSDEANLKLSHDRAKSVRDYMVKAGIASERLQAKGYGETQPVADNETEDGRKANKRTEFVILETE